MSLLFVHDCFQLFTPRLPIVATVVIVVVFGIDLVEGDIGIVLRRSQSCIHQIFRCLQRWTIQKRSTRSRDVPRSVYQSRQPGHVARSMSANQTATRTGLDYRGRLTRSRSLDNSSIRSCEPSSSWCGRCFSPPPTTTAERPATRVIRQTDRLSCSMHEGPIDRQRSMYRVSVACHGQRHLDRHRHFSGPFYLLRDVVLVRGIGLGRHPFQLVARLTAL